MDGLKIGGTYYGMDIQKAMEKAHKIVTDSAKEVYQDEWDIKYITVAIECYEESLIEELKNGTNN